MSNFTRNTTGTPVTWTSWGDKKPTPKSPSIADINKKASAKDYSFTPKTPYNGFFQSTRNLTGGDPMRYRDPSQRIEAVKKSPPSIDIKQPITNNFKSPLTEKIFNEQTQKQPKTTNPTLRQNTEANS